MLMLMLMHFSLPYVLYLLAGFKVASLAWCNVVNKLTLTFLHLRKDISTENPSQICYLIILRGQEENNI